jgi:hypothetical protein
MQTVKHTHNVLMKEGMSWEMRTFFGVISPPGETWCERTGTESND